MTTGSTDARAHTRIEQGSPSRAECEALASRGVPAVLVDCDLEAADLSNLDMTEWRFEGCVLKQADLTGAILENAHFVGCRGAFANFTAARLTEAQFQSSDFNNGIFTGATLTQTMFAGCKLTGADLSPDQVHRNQLQRDHLIGGAAARISFRKVRLTRVDFSLADLSKCDFRDAVFEDSSLREAHLVDARFEGADLRGADLGGLRLIDARKFKGATISRSQAGSLLAEMGLKIQ